METEDQPPLILAKACAAWGNPPDWSGVTPDCSLEAAEYKWAAFIEDVCANHGLVMVKIGILQEIER